MPVLATSPVRIGALAGMSALPQSERQDLIAEIRGLTQGLGAFEADFDHMAELHGRPAELAAQAGKAQAAAHFLSIF